MRVKDTKERLSSSCRIVDKWSTYQKSYVQPYGRVGIRDGGELLMQFSMLRAYSSHEDGSHTINPAISRENQSLFRHCGRTCPLPMFVMVGCSLGAWRLGFEYYVLLSARPTPGQSKRSKHPSQCSNTVEVPVQTAVLYGLAQMFCPYLLTRCKVCDCSGHF